MGTDWENAPSWAIGYSTNRCWVGEDGYNFLPSGGSLPCHPYGKEDGYVFSDFTIAEYRPGYATPTPRIAAHEFLERGVKHMRDRAVQRDSDAGERSMARAVAAFNAQEGTNLTEAQGWRFMIQLKYARAVNGVFVADDYEDLCAYGGLAGEAAAAEAK